jgi:hypothetical protein
MCDPEFIDTESDGIKAIDPASLLSVESGTPVPTPVKVTCAPVMTAPEGSSTTPVTVPRLVWARARNASAISAAGTFRLAIRFTSVPRNPAEHILLHFIPRTAGVGQGESLPLARPDFGVRLRRAICFVLRELRKCYSGKPTFLRRAFIRGSPRSTEYP